MNDTYRFFTLLLPLLIFTAFIDAKVSPDRNYGHQLNASEREDLTYIVRTLATQSLPKLLSSKSSLKRAGERIDHIHPLRFWQMLFLSEELKGYVHAMKDRKKVWKEFSSDCMKTLNEESEKNNLKPESIADFSHSLNIDEKEVANVIKQKRWNAFFDLLISKIPRTGDFDRYDM